MTFRVLESSLRRMVRRARAIVGLAVRLAAAVWVTALMVSVLTITAVELSGPGVPRIPANEATAASEIRGVQRAPSSSSTAIPPSTPAPRSPSVLAPRPIPAVTSQVCSARWPGKVDVTFSWPRLGSHDFEVWVELSLLDNDFQPGTFASAGPFEPGVTSYTWQGIRPGDAHYYRLNVLDAEGRHPGPTGNFVSGLCLSPAASLQAVTQTCSATPGEMKTSFAWSPGLQPSGPQWLDLSLFNNRFAEGTFVRVGPLPAATSTLEWAGLRQGSQHYWRVNTLAADGWHPSATGTFRTMSCGILEPPVAALSVGNDLLSLRERLRDEIDASGMNAAVAVTDLQTGQTVDVHGSDVRLPGCTINFFVLLSVAMDLQAGRYSEAEVGNLIASTVWSSNPVTARQLLLKTGLGDLSAGVLKVNHLLRSLGAASSLYDHPPGYQNHSPEPGRSNALTANDMNRALTHFYLGGVVNTEWRDYLLEKLTGVKPGLQYLIPAGASGATVAHKNGFSWSSGGWVDNDAGIVWFDKDGVRYAYALSFFAEDIPTKYADIPLGQTISRLTWEYFQEHYP